MTLTKSSIVNTLCLKDISFKESVKLIEAVLELIRGTLESGESIMISVFGKFEVRNKHQRKGRNPATGEGMLIDARRVVTFKCSPLLKQKINGE